MAAVLLGIEEDCYLHLKHLHSQSSARKEYSNMITLNVIADEEQRLQQLAEEKSDLTVAMMLVSGCCVSTSDRAT